MTEKVETAKPAAKAPKAEAPVAAPAAVKPVVAVCRINGSILPGTIFRPADEGQRKELFDLKAVEEPTDADIALFEKQSAPAAGEDFA